MDKKDIYEHLAKIYLDSSKKHKRKKKKHQDFSAKFLYLGIGLFVLILIFVFSIKLNTARKISHVIYQTALVIQSSPIKINYNFSAAKKEILSIQLKNLDLSAYKTLAFTVRRVKPKDTASLRIELVNNFQEKSEVYLKNIPNNWIDYKIALSDFKHMADRSKMKELLFITEEWNTKEKNDIIFIDNIRFLK